MEDKFTNQEEQLRELSEDFTLPIDTDALWDKVEAQLPPQSDERRPIIWWFASGMFIILVSLLFGLSRTSPPNKESANKNSSENTSIIAENTTPVAIFNNSKSRSLSESIDTPNNNSKEEFERSESGNTEVQRNTKLHAQNHLNTLTKPNKKEVEELKASNEITQPLLASSGLVRKDKNHTQTIVNSDSYDEKSSSQTEEEIVQNTMDEKSQDILTNPSFDLKNDQEKQTKERFVFEQPHLIAAIPVKTLEAKNSLPIPLQKITPLKTVAWLPYFKVAGGVNINQSKPYTSSDVALELTQFNAEKSLIGISNELLFGYESTSGWRWGIGLNHNRLVHRYNQNEIVVSTTEIDGTLASFIDDDGKISLVDGQLTETTITNYDLKWHRIHDLVNVQILVGKQLVQKGRFSLNSNVHLQKNIFSTHNGYYLSENSNSIEKFTSSESNPYQNSGLFAGGSLDVEYAFNQFSISVSPFVSLGLNSMTQNSNYYQLKNSLSGVTLGIVYRP
ncbi:MAG: hypothetical protein P1U56_13100 [Saprospiraceae bacterium]|nr:hypothetical protein [Saprospiraceae bacterium]